MLILYFIIAIFVILLLVYLIDEEIRYQNSYVNPQKDKKDSNEGDIK